MRHVVADLARQVAPILGNVVAAEQQTAQQEANRKRKAAEVAEFWAERCRSRAALQQRLAAAEYALNLKPPEKPPEDSLVKEHVETWLAERGLAWVPSQPAAAGSYGVVRACERSRDGSWFAVKIAKRGETLTGEATSLRLCNGAANVAQLADVGHPAGVVTVLGNVRAVVMPWVHGGRLAHAYEHPSWHPKHLCECISSLLQAVSEIHSRGLVHGDLHTGNLLVQTGPSCGVVLVDLGRAATAGGGLSTYARGWRAPEISTVEAAHRQGLPAPRQCRGLDVWAVCVTVACMACCVTALQETPTRQDELMKNLAECSAHRIWFVLRSVHGTQPAESASKAWEVVSQGLRRQNMEGNSRPAVAALAAVLNH